MNEQISLFDENFSKEYFYSKVQNVIDEVISSHHLPDKSIHLYSNFSESGKEKSKSICIYEPAYPVGAYGKDVPGKNLVVLNFFKMSPTIRLKIKDEQFNSINLPETAQTKVLKSYQGFHFAEFKTDDDSIYNYIKDNIIYCLANYKSSSSFDCCDRFIKCSDAKECVHDNKIYAMGCKYRAHLESGHIFYGKNKNI